MSGRVGADGRRPTFLAGVTRTFRIADDDSYHTEICAGPVV